MTNISKSELDSIISKVLQERANEIEQAKLKEWVNASSENKEIYRQLKIEWNRKSSPRKAVNEEELVDRIWSNHSSSFHASHSRRSKGMSSFILKSAAIILAIVTFAFIYKLNNTDHELQDESFEAVTKENKGGQKSKIYLTDGSIVWLNSNSSLEYMKTFKDDVREVASGYECGINIDNFNDIKVGDVIEAFIMEEIEASL